jgi:glucose/mannose-6-phosphate isomerase
VSAAGTGAPDGAVDTLDQFDAVARLPEQVATALAAVDGGVAGLPRREDVDHVVVLGMGGSGIAGDVLAAVVSPQCPVPIVVTKDYELPGFVGPRTMAIAVSCSGETEETVEAATEAAHAGAHMAVVCQGGRLAALAGEWGAPQVPVPADIQMPRTAVGALSVPLFVILEEVGLVPGAHQFVADAVLQLSRRRDALVRPGNAAEELARRIGRSFPLFYGAGLIGATAASRWKTQVNENAKAPAFANRVPELCHNEAAGWGQHGDVSRQLITLVQLRHDFEHPQVGRRYELVDDLVDEVVGSIHDVHAEGDGPLAQLFDLIIPGDFVTLHMAAQAGVDPGPIPALDYIKSGLTRVP